MTENQDIILIVEDEKSIRELLKLNLQMDGFQTLECARGDKAMKYVEDCNIHLVVLDVMLPGKNGVDLCREMKSRRPELPIIMLSALGQSKNKITGLRAGADDYVSKPFNYEELLLRINKQLNKSRIQAGKKQIVLLNGIYIDFTLHQVKKDANKVYKMSSKESMLLRYLWDNKNRVVSRKEIFANVWGYENFPNSRTVDNYIASLRKFLTINGKSPIQSERGVGYQLIVENSTAE